VDTGLRASAVAGLVALVLSVIVAIFSRIPFGILVLRAVLVSVCVFGLTYAINYILRLKLPELFSDAESSGDDAVGTVVDISIDDGGDLAYPQSLDTQADAQPARAATEALDQDDQAMGQLEREVEELHSDSLLPKEAGSAPGQPGVVRPSVTLDELDVLPDMDSMGDSFSSEVVSGLGSAEDDFPAGTGPSSALSSSSSAGDPAVLAKAVQTLLKRDQKG